MDFEGCALEENTEDLNLFKQSEMEIEFNCKLVSHDSNGKECYKSDVIEMDRITLWISGISWSMLSFQKQLDWSTSLFACLLVSFYFIRRLFEESTAC